MSGTAFIWRLGGLVAFILVAATATAVGPGVATASTALPQVIVDPPGSLPFARFFLPGRDNSENLILAHGTAGAVHAAFASYDGPTPSVYYGYCPSACRDPRRWTVTAVGTLGFSHGSVQLAITSTGLPRMMWFHATSSQYPDVPGTFSYAACDRNCTDAAGWSELVLPLEATVYFLRSGRYFALDALDRPAFLFHSPASAFFFGTLYLSCDADCTSSIYNWAGGLINTDHLGMFSLAFAGESPRVAYAALENGTVGYMACDLDCGSSDSWYRYPLTAFSPLDGAVSLRVDSLGRLRMALYRGSIASADPGHNKVAYLWCDDGYCFGGNWMGADTGFPVSHGEGVELALDASGRPHMAYYAAAEPFAVVHARCTADCESASSTWEVRSVGTADEMNASDPVPVEPGCSISTWRVGGQPSLALDAAGHPWVGYDARHSQGGSCEAHDDMGRVRVAAEWPDLVFKDGF
jgi:hypothetical protein